MPTQPPMFRLDPAAPWDREQVRPYLEAFAAVRAELDPSGSGYDAREARIFAFGGPS